MDTARYQKPNWGTHEWSKPEKTGVSRTTKKHKSIWPCICEKCTYSPPETKKEEYCGECKKEMDWCVCCPECEQNPDYCINCYICLNQECKHDYPCCQNCEQTAEECTCCPSCEQEESSCPYCTQCGKHTCEHPDKITCEEKETIDGKELEKEKKATKEEKENQGISNSKNADVISTQNKNVDNMSRG